MIKKQNGQATVELAISATVLFLLIFGMIDFGRVFHAYLTLNQASREAARVASVGGSDMDVQTRAFQAAASLDPKNVTVAITPAGTPRTRGSFVTVTLEYPVTISVPLIETFLPNPFIARSDTTMRVE